MGSATAKCERTGVSIPVSDGFIVGNSNTGEWSFVASGAPDQIGDYNISLHELCKSPEALVDWLGHMTEKTWFDAHKFVWFFARFRKDNSLYGKL